VYIYTVIVACVSIILIFVSLSSHLASLSDRKFSLSPLSHFISPLVHRSHLKPSISPISLTVDMIPTDKPRYTRPRNDTVAKLSGTWCVGLVEAMVTGYWSVGIDRGYWLGWWWVLMGIDQVDGGWDFDGWIDQRYWSALHRKPNLQKSYNTLFE